jgi:hypothetical protein
LTIAFTPKPRLYRAVFKASASLQTVQCISPVTTNKTEPTASSGEGNIHSYDAQSAIVLQVGKKMADYWEPSTKMLNDPTKFLDSLLTFDKDNIPESVIQKIEPYIGMENFTPEQVSFRYLMKNSASKASVRFREKGSQDVI